MEFGKMNYLEHFGLTASSPADLNDIVADYLIDQGRDFLSASVRSRLFQEKENWNSGNGFGSGGNLDNVDNTFGDGSGDGYGSGYGYGKENFGNTQGFGFGDGFGHGQGTGVGYCDWRSFE